MAGCWFVIVMVVGLRTSDKNPFLSVTLMLVKLELVKVLGGLPIFEIVQLKAPVAAEIFSSSTVIVVPLIEHVTCSTFVTPVQFITVLFAGGVSSAGRLNVTLSPFAMVRLL